MHMGRWGRGHEGMGVWPIKGWGCVGMRRWEGGGIGVCMGMQEGMQTR